MEHAIPVNTTSHDPLLGDDWIEFTSAMIRETHGERSSRPRLILEAILDAAAGYAACCITDRMMAARIGCKAAGIKDSLFNLRRLGIIHCITDPRIGFGRRIVLAQHPGAAAVLDELVECDRVAYRNQEFEPWFPREPETDVQYLELQVAHLKNIAHEHPCYARALDIAEHDLAAALGQQTFDPPFILRIAM
jgi:hypothetical protein